MSLITDVKLDVINAAARLIARSGEGAVVAEVVRLMRRVDELEQRLYAKQLRGDDHNDEAQ